MRLWKNKLVMTKEQESSFFQKTHITTRKYFWSAILFILIFQIYNILYALHYTNFKLHTKASRVYMALYIIMFFMCIAFSAAGLMLSLFKKQSSIFLGLYTAFGCFLLLWSVCISLYDHRLSNNMSIFMTAIIYIAGLFYMSPRITIPVFTFCEVFFISGLLWISANGNRDTYGSCVNSVGLTIVALFISLYRWSTLRQDFLNHLELEEKSRMITEQSEKLSYLANHDPLTGLWNRNYLQEWTEKFFTSHNTGKVAVFIADIDYFKQYNDTFGHIAGDECLKSVAFALLKSGTIVFRFGGEEFLCLYPNASEHEADKLAMYLCTQIQKLQIPSSTPEGIVTISIGFAIASMKDDLEFRDLLHKADKALYQAKSNGRNRAIRYGMEKFPIMPTSN